MSGKFAIFLCALVLPRMQQATSFSWYSTATEWQNLSWQDNQMLTDIDEMVIRSKSQLNQLLQKIEIYKEMTYKYLDDLNRHYNMKITGEYVSFFRRQASDLYQQFPFNGTMLTKYRRSKSSFPQVNDLNVVLRTLLTLQNSNNLNTKDLANGYIVDTYTGAKLSPNGLYDIATIACSDFTLRQCIEWCELAKYHVNDTEADYTGHDVSELAEQRVHNDRFSKLCAESLNHTYIEDAFNPKLKCFLWDNFHHPWLILRPVRAELLSTTPTVVLFYDVVTDQQISYVRKKAMQTLGKAQTLEMEKTIKPESYRVAHNCWLDELGDKTLKLLNRKIEAMTGLSVRRSLEHLQIANYGIGGHYYAHTDAMDLSPEQEITHRNRKATFMFYLSDVQHGGATVFVHAGVAVKPVKGAAVFWYNLKWDTGISDEKTLHGGCPVVLGDKWVANKWIWENSRSICEKNRFG